MGGRLTVVQTHKQLSGANSLGNRTHMVRSPRLLVTILVMVAVTLSMAACSEANEEPTNGAVLPTVDTVEPANGPVIPTYEPTAPVGFAAGLSGKLVVEGHCLYLVDDELGIRWFPVFKAGTVSWEKDTLVLHGERYRVGEVVSAGGGELTDLSHVRLLQEPDESCDVTNAWQVNGRQ